jgi:hypothetical protein
MASVVEQFMIVVSHLLCCFLRCVLVTALEDMYTNDDHPGLFYLVLAMEHAWCSDAAPVLSSVIYQSHQV